VDDGCAPRSVVARSAKASRAGAAAPESIGIDYLARPRYEPATSHAGKRSWPPNTLQIRTLVARRERSRKLARTEQDAGAERPEPYPDSPPESCH
jgi:hypothetical protein